MISRRKQTRSFAAGKAGTNGHAVAKALCRGDYVGQNIRVLISEEFTGAGVAALHFVQNHQPVVGIANVAQRRQIAIFGNVNAAFAKNRLDHHRNYIGVVSSNGLDGRNVVKRRTHKAAEQRLKARVDLAVTRGSKGRHGAAMKTAVDHDDGWRFDAFVVALKSR